MASIWSPVIGFELSAAHAIELGSNCKTDQPPQIGFELLVGPYPHSSSVAGTVPMVQWVRIVTPAISSPTIGFELRTAKAEAPRLGDWV